MFYQKLFQALLLFVAITTQAQQKLTYTPEKPKPGDVITFTYEPAGDIANTIKPVEGIVYQNGMTKRTADDIVLQKLASKYSGSFTIDTGMHFIYLSFSADKKFDNNFNEGYTIILYNDDKPRRGAYMDMSGFYQFSGRQVGVDRNNEKSLAAMEKEFELYPDNKKKYLINYVSVLTSIKKDDAPKIVQKEIESLLKAGLKEETDYSNLEGLYQLAKSPEQMKFVTSVKKEKFPNGKWVVNETIDKFYQEEDIEKKKILLAEISNKIETDENWKYLKQSLSIVKPQIAYAYLAKKDWPSFKQAVADANIEDKAQLAQLYNSAAWEMQKTSDNLPLAEEFSRFATTYYKEQWKNPTAKKPDNMTQKQLIENNKYMYAMFADTYGMVMYRMGEYKKGFPFAKDAAIVVNNGKDAGQNNTYALLAEKVLPKKQYVKEIEQFVMDAKSTSEMKEILKRAYVKDRKSEAGFDDYITDLQKSATEKMLEDLKKTILNEKAPLFALVDLDGKKVNLGELKDKVVVVDFWATWCGPCKASFPGMQKMVNKYKDDPNVKFVFIDTWENGDNKEKLVSEFINTNKYSFHVLMDNDSKVVADFKVDGIPTKFVIDKKGMIRFKAVGFDGSDDKLMTELTAMIEMASKESAPKAF
jgi:thiol-disulfide isomerase/thioredoxin